MSNIIAWVRVVMGVVILIVIGIFIGVLTFASNPKVCPYQVFSKVALDNCLNVK